MAPTAAIRIAYEHRDQGHLEDVVRRIEAGEHVTLTRDGKPVAEVEPAEKTAQTPGSLPRVGAFKDTEFWMADDFDNLGPEWDEYIK